MDNLRGIGGGEGFDQASFDDEDEDAVMEAPPKFGSDERRMQVRAYNYWASLLGNRCLPSIEDLEPDLINDFEANSVLLDFTAGIENPAIQYLGKVLARECEADEIAYLSDVPPRSLLSRITDHYMQILANQAPIGFEAEFVNTRGATVLYRGILLPFSSDDDTIDFVYGVINWKELADKAMTDDLMAEVEQSLAATPRKKMQALEGWDAPLETEEQPFAELTDSHEEMSFGDNTALDTGAFAEVPDEDDSGFGTSDNDASNIIVDMDENSRGDSFAGDDTLELGMADAQPLAEDKSGTDFASILNEESEALELSEAIIETSEAPILVEGVGDVDGIELDGVLDGDDAMPLSLDMVAPDYEDAPEEAALYDAASNEPSPGVADDFATIDEDSGANEEQGPPEALDLADFPIELGATEAIESTDEIEIGTIETEDALHLPAEETIEAPSDEIEDFDLISDAAPADEPDALELEMVVDDVDAPEEDALELVDPGSTAPDAEPATLELDVVDTASADETPVAEGDELSLDASEAPEAEFSAEPEWVPEPDLGEPDFGEHALDVPEPMAEPDEYALDTEPTELLDEAEPFDVGDTAPIDMPEPVAEIEPEPVAAFASAQTAPKSSGELASGLAVARDLAAIADSSAERTRAALYRAIGSAYDFSLDAAASEAEFADLLAEAGIERQERAPMTPIVKLIFGADYDKTRLAEYSAALGYAHRHGIARGDFAAHINEQSGGLKTIVADERAFRRGEESTQDSVVLPETTARKLRKLDALPIESFAGAGEEFVLVLTRRNASGELETIGAMPHDVKWLKQAAKKLLG